MGPVNMILNALILTRIAVPIKLVPVDQVAKKLMKTGAVFVQVTLAFTVRRLRMNFNLFVINFTDNS